MDSYRVYEAREASGYTTLQGTSYNLLEMNQQLAASKYPAVGVDVTTGLVVSVGAGASNDLVGKLLSELAITNEVSGALGMSDVSPEAAVGVTSSGVPPQLPPPPPGSSAPPPPSWPQPPPSPAPSPPAGGDQPWYHRRWVRGAASVAVLGALIVLRSGVFDGGSPIKDLEVGVCFNLPAGDFVGCEKLHDAETFALARHPAEKGAAFPGPDELFSQAIADCAPHLAGYVGAGFFESGYDILLISPSSDAWSAGTRTSACGLVRLDGQESEGSARDAGSILPEDHVQLSQVAEGECFLTTEWLVVGRQQPCADRHDFEVYAVLTVPSEADADDFDIDAVASYAGRACTGEFAKRVDATLATELVYGPIALPSPPAWELGQRTYVCALGARDGTAVTGSRLLARTQLDTLFGDTVPALKYVDFATSDGLTLVGSAEGSGQTVALTSLADTNITGQTQTGAAWYGEKVHVADGFETTFAFQFEMYSWFTVGEGMAFVIQNSGPKELDVSTSSMGYAAIPNSVAVEFDTTNQDWLGDPVSLVPGAPRLMGNHISVHTGGTGTNGVHENSRVGRANLADTVMANRAAHVAHLRYVPGELSVFIDAFDEPVLTVEIDLAETLNLDDGSAYVGFTAATVPGFYTAHRLLSWELATD